MIPVSSPLLDGNEKKYLDECISSGWISSEGPFVQRLESEFASTIGVNQPGCAVANGTAALEVALYALGVQPGDEVIVPSFTIISCATACLRLGAVPVLVDCDPVFWTMNSNEVESKISSRTKGIMAVHIYGAAVDMTPLLSLKKKYNLFLLEDIAEAIGGDYQGRLCGSIGDAAAVSFYANKLISCGEGGMVISSSPAVMERARSYRNLCFGKKERFLHDDIGYNFRMTNLQAAVGCAQLEQMDRFIAIKTENASRYKQLIAEIDGIRFMSFPQYMERGVYWMYAIELQESLHKTAHEAMAFLASQGIGVRPFFMGLHMQPALRGRVRAEGSFRNAEKAYRDGLYLPSGMSLHPEQIEYVCHSLRSFVQK